MSKDRCPYNSFFGEKVMIKERLSLIWGKFVNRETISYLIFGVLTTLVDWISYAVFRHNGMNYRMATICCQAAFSLLLPAFPVCLQHPFPLSFPHTALFRGFFLFENK